MVNRQNYAWVCEYAAYLREVHQLSPLSVGRYEAHLRHVLLWAGETSLAEAGLIRPGLGAYVGTVSPEPNGSTLAPATQRKIIQSARRLFTWAKAMHPREFKAVSPAWLDTLRPRRHPGEAAPLAPEHAFVALEDVIRLSQLRDAPDALALRRDRAAAAMLFLSGMRVGALGSLPLEAVDVAARTVRQWPSLGVKTKNRKSATTHLLPIPELLAVVADWDAFVRGRLPPTAMWATPIKSHWGELDLLDGAAGKNRSIALNKRLRALFALAGLPPLSPHKFRHGHAVWALQHARTMADYKAISQNLMHGDIRVTDGIYAPLLGSEIGRRVAGLAEAPHAVQPLEGDLAGYLGRLGRDDIPAALRLLADRLARA